MHTRQNPNLDRLSILIAIILLAYASARFINLPAREYTLQLPGLLLSLRVNVNTLVAVLVASITAAGADWLVRDHPALRTERTIQHWFLPSLTAMVLGFPLSTLPLGLPWWGVYSIGGISIVLVLVAEYIIIDPDDIRQPAAVAGLTALSFALFFILSYSLRAIQARLLFTFPALFITSYLVSIRTLHLRHFGRWEISRSLIVALIVGQVGAALHYFPLSAMSYGLILFGLVYATTSLIDNLLQEIPFPQSLVEPGLILLIVLLLAYFLR